MQSFGIAIPKLLKYRILPSGSNTEGRKHPAPRIILAASGQRPIPQIPAHPRRRPHRRLRWHKTHQRPAMAARQQLKCPIRFFCVFTHFSRLQISANKTTLTSLYSIFLRIYAFFSIKLALCLALAMTQWFIGAAR